MKKQRFYVVLEGGWYSLSRSEFVGLLVAGSRGIDYIPHLHGLEIKNPPALKHNTIVIRPLDWDRAGYAAALQEFHDTNEAHVSHYSRNSGAGKNRARPANDLDRCYACDAQATGTAEHGRRVVPACTRHRDPDRGEHLLKNCIYCDQPVRAGSLDIDGFYAHKKCHREACQ